MDYRFYLKKRDTRMFVKAIGHNFHASLIVNGKKSSVKRAGMTLVELMVVMGILVLAIGLLATYGLRDQPAKNRNTERKIETSAIANAISVWSLATGTYVPPGVPLGVTNVTCIGTSVSCYSLNMLIPNQLTAIPQDPKTGGQSDTGYSIYQDSVTKEIVITAPSAELGETIEARRK